MRSRLMVVGVVCLAVAVGSSIAWAAVGDGGTVKTCVAIKKGSLRAVDSSVSCKPGKELALTFYSKSGADAAFLGATAKAADSDKLDGLDSTAFLEVSGHVEGDGTVTGARGGLTATSLDAPNPTVFLLQYPGFDHDSPPIVALTPVGRYSETAPPTAEVIPSDDPDLIASLGAPPSPGIVVRVQNSAHKNVPGGFDVVIKP